MSCKIPLPHGKVAVVDAKDFKCLSQFKWYYSMDGYAIRNVQLANGKRVMSRMHKEILKPEDGLFTDHINGDGLDNRRCNLRECTHGQNQMNQKLPKNNTSGYKGVSWNKRCKKWQVRIYVEGKETHLGYFKDIVEAAKVYDKAALRHYGEFALTNESLNIERRVVA